MKAMLNKLEEKKKLCKPKKKPSEIKGGKKSDFKHTLF